MSVKQIAILTATVVALVVIVTLLKVGLGGRGSEEGPAPTVPQGTPHLTFPQGTDATTKPLVPGRAAPEEEVNTEGHHDFWFTNDKDAPVEVFLTKVSCGRCVSMQVALAPRDTQAAEAVAAVGMASAGPLSPAPQAAAQVRVPGPDVSWVKLEAEEFRPGAHGFTVPPKSAGWLRLVWNSEEQSQKMLSADLRTTSPAGSAPPFHLQVIAVFSDPIRVGPDKKEIAVPPLVVGEGKERVAWFTVYSSTRTRFTLDPEPEARQKERHRFVTCGKPVPVDPKDFPELEKEYKHAVLSAYRVPVTVREKVDGREHDLGPFHTTVALKTDATDEDVGLTVTGSVRGIVTVLAGEGEADQDRIWLGAFPRSIGVSKTVTVEAPADVDVAVDTVPAFLTAQLTPNQEKSRDGKKRWSLTVNVAANAVTGQFGRAEEAARGDTSSIYLKAQGRRVRIPVGGTAIQR